MNERSDLDEVEPRNTRQEVQRGVVTEVLRMCCGGTLNGGFLHQIRRALTEAMETGPKAWAFRLAPEPGPGEERITDEERARFLRGAGYVYDSILQHWDDGLAAAEFVDRCLEAGLCPHYTRPPRTAEERARAREGRFIERPGDRERIDAVMRKRGVV